jgi:hypothetical protein
MLNMWKTLGDRVIGRIVPSVEATAACPPDRFCNSSHILRCQRGDCTWFNCGTC